VALTKEAVLDALKGVFDPEIPVNIVDLGLVYDVEVHGDKVAVKMTLTTQGCPAAQALPEQARARVEGIAGAGKVAVELVWNPPWHPRRISAEGRKILGIPEGEFA
jgi:metal-sulfur cluster biosynthetic enzyme